MSHRVPIENALDLHAFAPCDIRSVVDEYIQAAHDAGCGDVRLVHGCGTGVQRGMVQQALERHPLVEASGMRRSPTWAPRWPDFAEIDAPAHPDVGTFRTLHAVTHGHPA